MDSRILRVSLLSLSVAWGARAEVPTYGAFQLQARSNFSSAYNLPDAVFFSNVSPSINDNARVAFNLSVIAGSDTQAVWLGHNGSGGIVFTSQVGGSISDVSLNDRGKAVFTQSFIALQGIYFYDASDHSSGFETNMPFGATVWTRPQINNAGEIGYRAGFAGNQAFVSFDGNSSTAIHAAEAGLDPNSPYSFLFTPAFNESAQIAGKVRRGPAGVFGESQPDEIRVFNSGGTTILIAEDQDANPSSPFTRFDNSVSLTDDRVVAFTANLASGNRVVVISDGVDSVTIAEEGVGDVSEIEFFAPAINNGHVVSFRGFDSNGLRAVWVGDGTTLTRLVGEHDLIETDLGTARIDQNDNSPTFGGSPSINACGDVVFSATLTPPDNNQIEWGSGIFVAIADRAPDGDYNCDEDVALTDVGRFFACVSGPGAASDSAYCGVFDFDGDADIDFADFAGLQERFAAKSSSSR